MRIVRTTELVEVSRQTAVVGTFAAESTVAKLHTDSTDTFIVTQCVATEQCCSAHGTSRLYASGLVVTRLIHRSEVRSTMIYKSEPLIYKSTLD